MTQPTLPGMLQTVARLYYTGIGRRYKRASVQPGPGEPLCLKNDAENAIRQAVFMAVVEERDQLQAEIERLHKYAEEYAAMAVATERKIWDMYISKARDQSKLVEGPNGPAVLMPYWVMRGPTLPSLS